jgi:NTP pyrophosphatase (non-canonical NTP hydrolase)
MRSEVVKFAEVMEKKLQDNEHKGGWENCSIDFLTYRLRQETAELFEALTLFHRMPNEQTRKLVEDECGDVGNFAMMIQDLVNKQLEEK